MLTFICAVILTHGSAVQPVQKLTVYFDQADVQSFEEDTHKKYASNDELHRAVCDNLQLAFEINAGQ